MRNLKIWLVSFCLLIGSGMMSAQLNLGNILGSLGNGLGSDVGDLIGGLVEGIFTKSNLTLEDLVGEYVSSGPAVTFKSDNFLQKAGGIAGATAIENKLQPYYEQFGLTGLNLTIQSDGSFSTKIKGIPLTGDITKNEGEGTFYFNLKVLGKTIIKMEAFIEKSGSNLNIMFDAQKLKELISKVAKIVGNSNSLVSAIAAILDSYEGAYIGMKMVNTSPDSHSIFPTTGSQTTNDSQSTDQNTPTGSSISQGLEKLKDILKKND